MTHRPMPCMGCKPTFPVTRLLIQPITWTCRLSTMIMFMQLKVVTHHSLMHPSRTSFLTPMHHFSKDFCSQCSQATTLALAWSLPLHSHSLSSPPIFCLLRDCSTQTGTSLMLEYLLIKARSHCHQVFCPPLLQSAVAQLKSTTTHFLSSHYLFLLRPLEPPFPFCCHLSTHFLSLRLLRLLLLQMELLTLLLHRLVWGQNLGRQVSMLSPGISQSG